MNFSKKIIYGDFLDGYIYSDSIFLHTNDETLNILNIDKLTTDNSTSFDELNNTIKLKKYKMNQFITDFDIYNGHLYYCNSDGVFDLEYKKINNENTVTPLKLWDADVQCLRIGNGGIAMSAANDGLYEYKISDEVQYCDIGKQIENKLHMITNNHSTSCKWTQGNLWNYSVLGGNSLFEYQIQKDNNIRKVYFNKEYYEKDFFDTTEKSDIVTVSERTKTIFRFGNGVFDTVKFEQSSKNGTKFSSKYHFTNKIFDGISKVYDIAEISVGINDSKESLYVYECENGLKVIDKNSKEIFSSSPIEEIVKWRVFPNASKYKNIVLIVLDDRIEIVSFSTL